MKSIKLLMNNIKRVFKWIPVIWRDRDYDYMYLLQITQFKLEQMADLHTKYGCGLNQKLYASEMLQASHLLMQAIEESDLNEEQEQKNIDEAFKYISKNLKRWWD